MKAFLFGVLSSLISSIVLIKYKKPKYLKLNHSNLLNFQVLSFKSSSIKVPFLTASKLYLFPDKRVLGRPEKNQSPPSPTSRAGKSPPSDTSWQGTLLDPSCSYRSTDSILRNRDSNLTVVSEL